MNLTPQQSSFIQEASQAPSNIALQAVAGAGKTTTLVEAAKAWTSGPQADIVPSALAVAFNKKTAEELAKRFPPSFTVKTMNALGHQAWGKQLGKRLDLNTEKISSLAQEISGGRKEMWQTPGLHRLIDLARLNEYTPEAPDEEWFALGEKFDIIDPDCEHLNLYPERCRKILSQSIRLAWQGQIDFCDQLYMPIAFSAPFQGHQLVMVDEAQDLSPIQQKMIRRATRNRLIIVGDPAQSIYGFAGAVTAGMSVFTHDFGMKEMPLTYSFRCPKSVVREAQRYNPVIQSHDWAANGTVRHSEDLNLVERGDTIVSYRNADLLSCVFACLQRGIGAKIIGSGDLGKTLKDLAGKWTFENRVQYIDDVQRDMEKKAAEFRAAGKKDRAERLSEQGQCLKIIVLGSPAVNDLPSLRSRIEEIFSLDGGSAPVICTTIHKAKGLEWPRVHFYNPGSLFRGFDKRPPEDQQQRRNMAYVALTRSKDFLNIVKPRKEQSDEE
jgi:DNA helicase-2/ATP-dependent DNA helicase PcrA